MVLLVEINLHVTYKAQPLPDHGQKTNAKALSSMSCVSAMRAGYVLGGCVKHICTSTTGDDPSCNYSACSLLADIPDIYPSHRVPQQASQQINMDCPIPKSISDPITRTLDAQCLPTHLVCWAQASSEQGQVDVMVLGYHRQPKQVCTLQLCNVHHRHAAHCRCSSNLPRHVLFSIQVRNFHELHSTHHCIADTGNQQAELTSIYRVCATTCKLANCIQARTATACRPVLYIVGLAEQVTDTQILNKVS